MRNEYFFSHIKRTNQQYDSFLHKIIKHLLLFTFVSRMSCVVAVTQLNVSCNWCAYTEVTTKKMHINHVEIEARLQNDLACPSLFFSNWVIAVVQVANILVRKFIQKMPMHVLKNHWDCCDFAAGNCRLLPLLTLLFLSILFLPLLLLLLLLLLPLLLLVSLS